MSLSCAAIYFKVAIISLGMEGVFCVEFSNPGDKFLSDTRKVKF
jgi:hypothetical protein